MISSSLRRPYRVFGAVALLGVSLVLMGCGTETATVTPDSEPTSATGPATEECAGVSVVVEFGSLDTDGIVECVDTSEPMTAVRAFELANVELTEGQAFPGSICRVGGAPAADLVLNYSGQSYTEDCTAMGPVWAYWGLFVDLGNGWEYAQEGAATQLVEPGQGIAFSWQFGDTTEPQLPAA